MGKCVVCGKKGLFLKIDSFGRCESCQIEFEIQEAIKKQKELTESQPNTAEKQAREQELSRRQAEYEASQEQAARKQFLKQEKARKESDREIVRKRACFFDILDGQYVLSYRYDFVKVSMPSIDGLQLGDNLSLELEPDNQFDPHAIKILSGSNEVGYLFHRKLQSMVHDFVKRGCPVAASVDSLSIDGFTCGLGFYRDINTFDSVSATLTKTSKKDFFGTSRQDNLSFLSKGDALSFEYNYDSETYVVSDECGNEVGELSKSLSDKLYSQEDEYEYIGICIENEVDDSLKYQCKIKILKMI